MKGFYKIQDPREIIVSNLFFQNIKNRYRKTQLPDKGTICDYVFNKSAVNTNENHISEIKTFLTPKQKSQHLPDTLINDKTMNANIECEIGDF